MTPFTPIDVIDIWKKSDLNGILICLNFVMLIVI